MPRAIDTVTISFGLVSIPVKVFPVATHTERLTSHLLHAKCGTRLKQQLVCPKDDEVVARKDAMRGYESEDGKVVALTQAEVKEAAVEASDAIAVAEFVPLDSVDPVSYDSAYYLAPDGTSKATRAAYGLFLAALRASDLVAIGETVARGREDLVMLRAGEDLIIMHRLRRPQGVRAEGEITDVKVAAPSKAELAMADQLIQTLRHDTFDPSQYSDESMAKLRDVIEEQKEARGTAPAEDVPVDHKGGHVIDLMAALRKSLDQKPAARATKRKAPAKRAAAGRGR